METRQAAAEALRDLPCGSECVVSVLHYLERIASGESNSEDRWVPPPSVEEAIARMRKKSQQGAYDALYSVLRNQKRETLTALAKVYGLGTPAPSVFALDLVSRAALPEACPLLLQSDRDLRELPDKEFRAPRQELQASLSSLKCK
ncbi:MAG TPA: hypothetical protein VKG84_15090 [Candidatus Acidoferrales bacterium]|nr:hypothetical protein [Candidatus Acidoferrales bacterium]